MVQRCEYGRDDLIASTQLFGGYVNLLYPLKEAGIKRAKSILNCLWGALVQACEVKMTVDATKEQLKLVNAEITALYPSGKNHELVTVKFRHHGKQFETPYGRIKPFILALGRQKLITTMTPYVQHVKRVHTDSIYSTIKLDVETGENLGELSCKGFCENAEVINATKVKGVFQ